MINSHSLMCPNCSTPFTQVILPSHYDAPIALEQCQQCGGIWFDQEELFSLQQGTAKSIDSLNKKILSQNELIHRNLFCPKDKTALIPFRDLNFPKEIDVEKCKICGGFWLNRGELTAYQDFREKRQKERQKPNQEKDDQLGKQIKTLLASRSDVEKFERWGAWGKEMSQPVTSMNQSIFGRSPQKNTYTPGDILGSLLQIIMMFIFKR